LNNAFPAYFDDSLAVGFYRFTFANK